MIRYVRFLIPAVISLLLLAPSNVFSCGPYFPEAVFTYQGHPDYPLKLYARGDIGIIQPRYHRTYLVVAYRYLAGKPLSPSEQEGALSAWYGEVRGPFEDVPKTKTPVEKWLSTRDKMLGARPVEKDKWGNVKEFTPYSGGYSAYLNCPNDAFQTALNTFADRLKRYSQQELVEWMRAQDVVFSNCEHPGTIPATAPQNASSLFRADRTYQIASAQFYRGDFDAARASFQKIAGDSDSPWRDISSYLATRTLIRKAALSAPEGKEFLPDILAQAESDLKGIISDPNQKSMHEPARKLLGFVSFRLHPEQRSQELARALQSGDRQFEQDLIDYTRLLDKLIGEAPALEWNSQDTWEVREAKEKASEREYKKARYNALRGIRSSSILTDWVLTFQSDTQEAAQHALNEWKRTAAVPWLVACMAKAHASDQNAEDLLKASMAVSADSPAFATVLYHRVRILRESGRGEESRTSLDKVLPELRTSATPPSTMNALLTERMQVADSFEEFVNFAARHPVNVGMMELDSETPYCEKTADCEKLVYGDKFETATQFSHFDQGSDQTKTTQASERFDSVGASIFNKRLPLALLVQAAHSDRLPTQLRTEIALAAWSRAAILGDAAAAKELGPLLSKNIPALASYIAAYDKETSEQGRKFAGVFALLHFPGMRPYVDASNARETALDKIDSYRDNWWCADVGANIDKGNMFKEVYYGDSRKNTKMYDPNPGFPFPQFLTAQQKQAAEKQWNALSQIGTGPNYLTAVVLTFAKSHPDDGRIPEALHFAVRSTRYGCENKQTTHLSREAFDLLHQHYPQSQWTKKTRYWF